MVETGVQRQLTMEDLPEVSSPDDTLGSTQRLYERLDRAERGSRKHPLLSAVVGAFWPELLVLQAVEVVIWSVALLNPLLLKRVLIFQEQQEPGSEAELSSPAVKNGLWAVYALVFLAFFNLMLDSQRTFFRNRVGIRINSALRGAIMLRWVRGGPGRQVAAAEAPSEEGAEGGRSPAPSVYNVISFDIGPNIDIIWIILGLWLFPFQLISVLAVLYQEVAWAAFPGLVVIVVAKLLCLVSLYLDGLYRDRLLTAKDTRLSRCDEGFNRIRTLQMLAWPLPFQQNIAAARREELRVNAMRLWFQKMVAALDYSLGPIVTLVTLGFYVRTTNGFLKASVALPVIGLVNSLVGPFGQFPIWTQQYLVWRSAYKRVNDCMGLGGEDGSAGAAALGGGDGGGAEAGAAVAAFEDCTMAWGSDVATAAGSPSCGTERRDLEDGGKEVGSPLLHGTGFGLRGLNLRFAGGSVTAIVGREGQGKTSLLRALLGDMAVVSGAVDSPALRRRAAEDAVGGSRDLLLPDSTKAARAVMDSPDAESPARLDAFAVPFAAQEATLFSGTVRDNILFNTPFRQDLYDRVVSCCCLDDDFRAMPIGDLTEVAQGGATLSGGQRARVCLARAAYRASLLLAGRPAANPPLVLLDDPFCSLDPVVAEQVSRRLLASPDGLLAPCAVVVATADAWWLGSLAAGGEGEIRAAVLRDGALVAAGGFSELLALDLPELQSSGASGGSALAAATAASEPAPDQRRAKANNPQGDSGEEDEEDEAPADAPAPSSHAAPALAPVTLGKFSEAAAQTTLLEAQTKAAAVIKDEVREAGGVKWSTYECYFSAIGPGMLAITAVALVGIMVFQNLCNLAVAYWTATKKTETFMYKWSVYFGWKPPEDPGHLLWLYAAFVGCFVLSNFSGHGLEIIGGMRAAKKIFLDALQGTFQRPFRWWDANPTGRVLNRFSEDVEVMDLAVTNILGVIFGAVLFFLGHTVILALANPTALTLLPVLAFLLEYFAGYYRASIREIQRCVLVCMSRVYQDMVETVQGRATVCAFAAGRPMLCRCAVSLDDYQKASFAKTSLNLWIGLRMACVGFIMSAFSTLYPALQYYGYLSPQSAALVGFSITYSQEVVGIIQQFIMNYSDLEMQMVSIERLREYADVEGSVEATAPSGFHGHSDGGLLLTNVTVTYRQGLLPALRDVSLSFAPREAVAIVGRTGAGKSSLLLAILQLVPYEGSIEVGGRALRELAPCDVRRQLVGVVPQNPVLFAGSLRWNLDPFGVHSDEELGDTLAAVGLRALRTERKEGLDAQVVVSGGCVSAEEGLSLSQGQQQLLCAARVLLRRPKVAALDEVTASLPQAVAAKTVSELIGRFREQDAVVLLITHQASLLPNCERVVQVAAGRVVDDRRLASAAA